MRKVLHAINIEGQHPIELIQTSKARRPRYPADQRAEGVFTVRYGHDRKTGLSRIAACSVLGSSIIHALECAGHIEGN